MKKMKKMKKMKQGSANAGESGSNLKRILILLVTAILLASVMTVASAEVCPDGMLSYWKFDEGSGTTAADSYDANPGTVNGATWTTTGQVGGALSFDGSDDYVSVPNDPSLEITGPITLEAWVNFSSLGATSDFNGIVAKWCHADQGGTGWGYGLFKSPGTNRIAFITASSQGGGYADAYSNSVPSVDTWYHVVGTYDGTTTMLLYINGSLQTDTGSQTGIYDNDEPVTIGTFEQNNNFWFDGEIDEVAIYNRTLSAEEIVEHYQNGLADKGYCEVLPLNNAPEATANGPYSGREGTAITFDASGSSDPDGDTLQYSWDFDNDGTWDIVGSDSPYASYTWNDDWSGTAKVEVSDGEFTDANTASVTITNVAPIVDAGADQTVNEGDPVTIGPIFTDAGSDDSHTATIDWGDGSTATSIDPATSPLSGTHTYTDDGSYTVTVTVTDDDVGVETDTLTVTVNSVAPNPGITVNPTSGLVTTEAGEQDTFTVVLMTEPTSDVTIGLSSSDTSEGTVSPISLTFSTTDWDSPQTVTITGVDDTEVDGPIAYTIDTAATSADTGYDGLDADDVSVTNLDIADLSVWSYSEIIQISGLSSSVSDYQVLVEVDTASLISADKMQPDGDDIRFTESDGETQINYWIESGTINTDSTKIWVKVTSIPTSGTTIYMYYGNAGASSASNGAATFEFFDDFDDLGNWEKVTFYNWGADHATISATIDGKLRIVSTGSNRAGPTTTAAQLSQGQKFEAKMVTRSGSAQTIQLLYLSEGNTYENIPYASNVYEVWIAQNHAGSELYNGGDGSGVAVISHPYIEYRTTTDYVHFGTREKGEVYNESSVWDDTDFKLAFYACSAGTIEIDWVFVRKYAETEAGDTTPPVITCPVDLTVSTDAGLCYATGVDLGSPTVSDNCDLNPAVTNDAPEQFPNGTTTVTWTATDVSGNSATCTQTVTVNDNEEPAITCPVDVTVSTDVGLCYATGVALGSPTVSDNCDLNPAVTNDAPEQFPIGTTIVTWTATDVSGNSATCTTTVTVQDTTAPVITLTGAATITLECGDTYEEFGATASDNCCLTEGIVIASTVDTATPGSYTVTYDVNDCNGNAATQVTRTVNVVDTTAPVITLTGDATITLECGDSYVDPGATASDNCCLTEGIVIASTVDPATLGSYTVTYDVNDCKGNAATQVTRTVNVVDTTAPVISLVGDDPQVIECGDSYVELGATASDNCCLTEEIVIAGTVDTATPGLYTVTYDVTDCKGNAATQVTRTVDVQVTVTVNNIAPTVDAITAPLDPVLVDTLIVASASFTDPDTADVHTAEWDWGDAILDTVTVADGSRTVTGSHTYTTPGVYTIKLTVTDRGGDGESGELIYHYVVVYDPEGGFVTGGGWIDSPEGAYAPAPELTGKANFGFVSKYKKGATVPTGQTEFRFKAGDLNFHSSSYQWLVIAGHKAKYKGDGKINGAGNYGFMLSAIDADLTPSTNVDLFRIKIWNKDDGDAVVYDNQMDAEDDADATTAIGGGSIKIHGSK